MSQNIPVSMAFLVFADIILYYSNLIFLNSIILVFKINIFRNPAFLE